MGTHDDLPAEERRYTPKAIADGWNINPRTVHRWVADGLPAINVGSAIRPDYRIRLDDVREYLARRDGLTVEHSGAGGAAE
jgi:hypothetical protein